MKPAAWLRALAWGAWTAAVLSRSVVPGLHGSGVLADEWVGRVETTSEWLSQAVMLGLLAWLLDRAFATLRAERLSLVFRLTFTTLAGLSFGFAAPALAGALPSRLALMLAHATVLMALLAAGQTWAHPSTRAAGFWLAGMGLATLTRVGGWLVALTVENPSVRLTLAPMVTVAWGVKALTVLGVLLWVARQRRSLGARWLRPVLLASVALAWGSQFTVPHGAATTPWETFGSRALSLWAEPSFSLVPVSFRFFVAALVPLLALIALLLPRAGGAVSTTCIALLLIGGVDADVPFCALCTAVASLGLVLSPYDDPSR